MLPHQNVFLDFKLLNYWRAGVLSTVLSAAPLPSTLLLKPSAPADKSTVRWVWTVSSQQQDLIRGLCVSVNGRHYIDYIDAPPSPPLLSFSFCTPAVLKLRNENLLVPTHPFPSSILLKYNKYFHLAEPEQFNINNDGNKMLLNDSFTCTKMCWLTYLSTKSRRCYYSPSQLGCLCRFSRSYTIKQAAHSYKPLNVNSSTSVQHFFHHRLSESLISLCQATLPLPFSRGFTSLVLKHRNSRNNAALRSSESNQHTSVLSVTSSSSMKQSASWFPQVMFLQVNSLLSSGCWYIS